MTTKLDLNKRFKIRMPDPVRLEGSGMVKESFLNDNRLPLVLTPAISGIDLVSWCEDNIGYINERLDRYGGVLFRGFDLRTKADFEAFTAGYPFEVMQYMEGATPRSRKGNDIFSSTEHPKERRIALHNELSYVNTWPNRIMFFCETAPTDRGQTPIADSRKILQRIDPKIRERFVEKGWMLVRNFRDGLSLPWQRSFHTDNKEELESYFTKADVQYEWLPGGALRTRQRRPAIARHPRTKESIWFNHIAFWHVQNLDEDIRASMLELYKDDELPYNAYYGDGSPIEPEVLAQITRAYDQEELSFDWEQGDLIILDNMSVCHGRAPFSGPRSILVAMGEPCSDRGV